MAQGIHLVLLLLSRVPLLTAVQPDEDDELLVEVVVDSSPCSVTCGLGVKSETLCAMTDGNTAAAEGQRPSEAGSTHPAVVNKRKAVNQLL